MTKIKLCGLKRECDIKAANELKPEYIGFVFWKKSKRYVSPETASELKSKLSKDIAAVGVFVDEKIETVAKLLFEGVIDIAQLHGSEDEAYIEKLRLLTDKTIIKAFRVESESDIIKANESKADYVLLDSGYGTGEVFDWSLIKKMKKPYFLAGGLGAENVKKAIDELNPYAVDVSSKIETDGFKDEEKMRNFVFAVRGKENEK